MEGDIRRQEEEEDAFEVCCRRHIREPGTNLVVGLTQFGEMRLYVPLSFVASGVR